MKLEEILNSEPVKPVEKKDEMEVEKLAEVLEALAEEDTLLDDLARAAVAFEMMEKRYG